MAPLDGYLKDPEYSNWVKSGLALNITNKVLRPFVVKEITKLHQSIVKKLSPGVSCGGCRVNNGCPNGICDKIQREIEFQHWYPNPSFTNTCTERWSTEPWEIAKCYMSPSKGCKSSSAADADFSDSINVIINCKHFQAFGTSDPRGTPETNIAKSKDFRNSVMHDAFSRRVSEDYMKEHLDVLINILNMVKTPETEADTKEAIRKIEQIKTNQLVLKLEDVIEVRKNATEAIADETEKDKEQVQRERLLVNFEAGCRKALCRLTEEHISKQEEKLSVADFLSRIRFLAVVKNLCSRHQNMLFPKSGTHAHIKEWDMFVYCFLLEELDLHEEIGNAVSNFVREAKTIRDKLLLDAKGVFQNDLSELCEYLIDTDLNTEITQIFNKASPDFDVIRSNNSIVSWWREEEDYGNKQVSKKQLNSYRHILKEIDERLAECKDVLEKMEKRGKHVELEGAYAAGIDAECKLKVCGCDKKTETVLQKDITSSNNDDIEKRESLNDFCRKLNIRDVNPEEGSIILKVTCSSITNVLDFWDSCIDGRAVEALSKVRDYYRRYFECDTLEFDVILTKKGVSRCVNKIVEGLPSHFEELVDKVTHKGHEILKTRDEDLITGSVENLRFDDEGGDDQANLAGHSYLGQTMVMEEPHPSSEDPISNPNALTDDNILEYSERLEIPAMSGNRRFQTKRKEEGINQKKQSKDMPSFERLKGLFSRRRKTTKEKKMQDKQLIPGSDTDSTGDEKGYSYLGPTMVMEEPDPYSKDPINNPNALTADEIIEYSNRLGHSGWETFAKDLGYTRNQIDQLKDTYQHQIYDIHRLHKMLQKWHDVVVGCGENPKHLLAAAFIRIGDIDVAERLLPRGVSLIALEELRPKRKTAERIHRITFEFEPQLITYLLSQRRRYHLAGPYTSSGAGYAYDFPHSDAYITCGERIPGSDKDPTSVDEGSEVWTSSFDHSYLSETIVMGEHHYSSEDPISNPNALTDDEIIECSWELEIPTMSENRRFQTKRKEEGINQKKRSKYMPSLDRFRRFFSRRRKTEEKEMQENPSRSRFTTYHMNTGVEAGIHQEKQIKENRLLSLLGRIGTRGEAGIHQEKQIKEKSSLILSTVTDVKRVEEMFKQEKRIKGHDIHWNPSEKDLVRVPTTSKSEFDKKRKLHQTSHMCENVESKPETLSKMYTQPAKKPTD